MVWDPSRLRNQEDKDCNGMSAKQFRKVSRDHHQGPTFRNARSPWTIYYKQIVSQLISWKAIDNDIVLLGDFNRNVYSGRLAHHLAQDDLNLTEICRQHTGIPIPTTFQTGSVPIDGIFATPSIKCVNVLILPHLGGVGDH